jgi:hypothetical protein
MPCFLCDSPGNSTHPKHILKLVTQQKRKKQHKYVIPVPSGPKILGIWLQKHVLQRFCANDLLIQLTDPSMLASCCEYQIQSPNLLNPE